MLTQLNNQKNSFVELQKDMLIIKNIFKEFK